MGSYWMGNEQLTNFKDIVSAISHILSFSISFSNIHILWLLHMQEIMSDSTWHVIFITLVTWQILLMFRQCHNVAVREKNVMFGLKSVQLHMYLTLCYLIDIS